MDYIISGMSEYTTLEGVVKEMFTVDSFAPITKVLVWDELGKVNQSIFHTDSSFSSAMGIIEFQYEHIHRISFLLNVEIGNYKTKIEISFYVNKENIIIEGQLYLEKLIDLYSNNQLLINDLANFLARLAQNLKLKYINVSDEDNESLIIDSVGVFLPDVFGIFNKQLLNQKIKRLDDFHLKIKSILEYDGYYLVIINPDFQNSKLDKKTNEFFVLLEQIIKENSVNGRQDGIQPKLTIGKPKGK